MCNKEGKKERTDVSKTKEKKKERTENQIQEIRRKVKDLEIKTYRYLVICAMPLSASLQNTVTVSKTK